MVLTDTSTSAYSTTSELIELMFKVLDQRIIASRMLMIEVPVHFNHWTVVTVNIECHTSYTSSKLMTSTPAVNHVCPMAPQNQTKWGSESTSATSTCTDTTHCLLTWVNKATIVAQTPSCTDAQDHDNNDDVRMTKSGYRPAGMPCKAELKGEKAHMSSSHLQTFPARMLSHAWPLSRAQPHGSLAPTRLCFPLSGDKQL